MKNSSNNQTNINWEEHKKALENWEMYEHTYGFKFLHEAPDTKVSLPLNQINKIYFSTHTWDFPTWSIAFDLPNKKGFLDKPRELLDAAIVLNEPAIVLTDVDIQELLQLFERHQIQLWDKSYHLNNESSKQNHLDGDGSSWELYILYNNETKEYHGGRDDTIAPENYISFRDQLRAFAERKMEEHSK